MRMRMQNVLIIIVIVASVLCIVFTSIANEKTYMMKGIKAEEGGEYYEAINNYKKVLSENPKVIDLYSTIGRIYQFKLNDIDSAIQIYQIGLKIEPHNFDLNRSLMYIYFSQKRIDDGLKLYQLLSDLRREEEEQYAFPRDTLTSLFKDKTQEEKLNFCKKYLALNSNDFILKEFLAEIYMEKKDYAAAKREYQSMVDSSNETGFIYFSLGVCDYYLGQYEDSLKAFNKAKELGSNVPQNYFNLINKKMHEEK